MSPYKRGRRGNALPRDRPRLSNGGNADIGQRDSGYSVVSSIHRWPDTEPAISLMREMELGPGQTNTSRGVCESALEPRYRWEDPRKKPWPRLRTGPGKTGCPGACPGKASVLSGR